MLFSWGGGEAVNLELEELRRVTKAGELLEQAALTRGGLSSVFEEVSGLMNLEMIQLFNFTHVEAPELIVAPERTGITKAYLEKGWHEFDIYSHAGAKLHGRTRYISDFHLLSAEVRGHDGFYQDFCPEWGIGGFTSWTFEMMGERWAYTLMPRASMALTSEARTLLDVFRSAADRACTLASTLATTRARSVAEGLELGGKPTIVLDHRGRVGFMSPAAEALVGQGFSLRGGFLQGHHRETDAAMRKLTVHAGHTRKPQMSNFLIHRVDGRKPIIAMPIHARDHGLEGLPGARILVMLADLEYTPSGGAGLLIDIFGLSNRESDLALRLASGRSPEEAASGMQISINTVRQMVKTLFAKTNTSTQAQLVGLVCRIVA